MKKLFNDTKWRNRFLIICGVVLLLVMFLLMAIEPLLKNKVVIKNKSSHKITTLSFWYEDETGTFTEEQAFGEVAPKERIKEDAAIDLKEMVGTAWLTIKIAFEDGGEALIQTGEFTNTFEGRVKLDILDTKGEDLMLRLHAGEGLFNSTDANGCDVVYYVNPKDGYIE